VGLSAPPATRFQVYLTSGSLSSKIPLSFGQLDFFRILLATGGFVLYTIVDAERRSDAAATRKENCNVEILLRFPGGLE
jgi:hypothetical protein